MACKSKVQVGRRFEAISTMESTLVPVYTFSPTKRIANIVIEHGKGTIKDLKNDVAQELGLLHGSQKIFAIFLGGRLMNPKKVFLDEDIINLSSLGDVDKKYCLQRIALDEEKENSVIENDPTALELLYWEVKERQKRALIRPKPTTGKNEVMKILLHGADHDPQKQKEFLDYVRKNLREFYYNFYHRVDFSILCSKVITAEEPRATEKSQVAVALGYKKLIISYLDDEGKIFDFCFNWDKVHSIDLDRTRCRVMFEVLLEDVPGEQYQNIFRRIDIQSERHEYIYSVCKYILTVYGKIAKYEAWLYDHQLQRKKEIEYEQVMSRMKQEDLRKAVERIRLQEEERKISQPIKGEETSESQHRKGNQTTSVITTDNEQHEVSAKVITRYEQCEGFSETKQTKVSGTKVTKGFNVIDADKQSEASAKVTTRYEQCEGFSETDAGKQSNGTKVTDVDMQSKGSSTNVTTRYEQCEGFSETKQTKVSGTSITNGFGVIDADKQSEASGTKVTTRYEQCEGFSETDADKQSNGTKVTDVDMQSKVSSTKVTTRYEQCEGFSETKQTKVSGTNVTKRFGVIDADKQSEASGTKVTTRYEQCEGFSETDAGKQSNGTKVTDVDMQSKASSTKVTTRYEQCEGFSVTDADEQSKASGTKVTTRYEQCEGFSVTGADEQSKAYGTKVTRFRSKASGTKVTTRYEQCEGFSIIDAEQSKASGTTRFGVIDADKQRKAKNTRGFHVIDADSKALGTTHYEQCERSSIKFITDDEQSKTKVTTRYEQCEGPRRFDEDDEQSEATQHNAGDELSASTSSINGATDITRGSSHLAELFSIASTDSEVSGTTQEKVTSGEDPNYI